MLLVLNGSARPDSPSVCVARLLVAQLEASGATARLVDLSTDPDPTELFTVKGLVIVVEEIGGSYSGDLKQFLDRVYIPEVFAHLPCAFVGVSTGPWGAIRAVEQLELALHAFGAHLFGTRIFMKHIADVLDKHGEIGDPDRRARLRSMMEAFTTFVFALGLADPSTDEVVLNEPVSKPPLHTEEEPFVELPEISPSDVEEATLTDLHNAFDEDAPTVVVDVEPPAAVIVDVSRSP